MIDGYSVEQIRAAEAPHLAAGEPLMRRAAAGLARVLLGLLPSPDDPDAGGVLILVGSGANGGDALFAGAELASVGYRVSIVPTAEGVHSEGLAAALAAGAELEETDTDGSVDVAELVCLARDSDVVVDGILGTGTSPNAALRGRARAVVSALRPVVDTPDGPIVVAVDIPSGIGPNDGSVPDPTVLRAGITVTFGGCKAGLLREPALHYAGLITVIDIGIGDELAAVVPFSQSRVTRTGARPTS